MISNQGSASIPESSPRKASIIAGLGLLLMAVLAPIANFSALQSLTVTGDAAATASKIMASIGLFRIGICFFLLVAILDVIVAWALYVLFKPVDKSLSLLSAWFRIVYAAIFAAASNHLFQVLPLLSGADYLKVFEVKQLHAQVLLHLDAFQKKKMG